MRILNLNPDHDLGASAWAVDVEGHRLLLDAGDHPKREGPESLPLYDLIVEEELDAIAITHCHQDHVGSLPIIMREFPKAKAYLTESSYILLERVLHNSVNVMMRQRDEHGRDDYPLYTHDEVDEMAHRFDGIKYQKPVTWTVPARGRRTSPGLTLEFRDAGHTLGSAGVLVKSRHKSLFYTGDVCFHDQTLLRGAKFEGIHADVLIMETTRGARATPPGFTRAKELDRLAAAISKATARGGCVLLPVFALGRTQEILAALALLMRKGRLKEQPVFIGGLGRVFTEIYDLQASRTHRSHKDLVLRQALNLQVPEREMLAEMNLRGGRLFVITAGMMTEGTAAHDLAARMIEHARHAIFLVGYADPDSPAGRLKSSEPGKPFFFSDTEGQLTRRCELDSFDLTAHANREDLLAFVGRVKPKVVILGHGDGAAREWFATQIHKKHPKIKVFEPGPGEEVQI